MEASKLFKDPWGWSKLDCYRECPQKFKYRYMEKLKEPESDALIRGSQIHSAVEMYLNGWALELPEWMSPDWKKRLRVLKDRKPTTEAAWGLTQNWKPLNNWLNPGTWLRAKSDVYYLDADTLVLIDIKTGKYRIPSTEQIELYAIVGHAHFPQVERVRTSFWFVDQESVPHEEVYTAKQLLNLRGKYEQEASKLYKVQKFAPTPGAVCRYCAFTRQKGGPCKY